MRDLGGPRGSGALGPGLRAAIALGLVGLLAGFLWGVADVPRYTATAGVIVSPTGNGEIDSTELGRYASLGTSSKVASKAAGVLGGDVAGGDLLSEVTVVPSTASSTLLVSATAESPDIAAATANGYARALVDVGGKRLEAGAAATIPGSPSENRSALLWSALGLLVGLLIGGAAAVLLARRRSDRPARAIEAPPREEPAATEPREETVEDAFGVPVLAATAIDDLIEELGIDEEDAPRTVAVLEPEPGEGADDLTIRLASAVAALGLRVIVVEADLATPTIAAALDAAPAPGLRDYLDGRAGPRDVLRSAPAGPGDDAAPLVFVPAGESHPNDSPALTGPRFEALLDRLPRVYDLVLVSGPPVLAGDDAADLAERVEGVVLVAGDRPEAAGQVADAVERIPPESLLAGVLTPVSSPQSRPQGALPRA